MSDEIRRRSEEATRKAIRTLPAGTYEARSVLDLTDGSEIVIQPYLVVGTDAEKAPSLSYSSDIDGIGQAIECPVVINH